MPDAKDKDAVAKPTSETEKQEFRFNTLDFVVSILDSHAGNFRAHAHAVARYSKIIAAQLKLSANEIEEIVNAAYLHDFNKLIELKKITYDIMEVLKTLNAPKSLRDIIMHMHERFDGQGQPDGLQGESIPLGSRILAVANMLDEISRGKVDTQVIRRDEAFESLRRRAHSYLDPKIVEILIAALRSSYRQYFKENDARLLVAATADDLRFQVANTLMESGYTVRTTKEDKDTYENYLEFSPHVVVVTVELFQQLLTYCRKHDVFIQRPVLVMGSEGVEKEINSNEYINIEDFVALPLNPQSVSQKVETAYNRVMKAEAQYRDNAAFLEKAGQHAKAADIYRDLGDFRRAAEMYEHAQQPAAAGAMYELLHDYKRAAKAFEQAGNLVKAAAYYREEGMYEDRARVYELAGDYYYTAKNRLFAKDTAQALYYFSQVKPEHEKYRKACYYMAKIHMEQKQWSEAVKLYEIVVANEVVDPDNLRYFYNYAIALECINEPARALEIYEKILGVDYNFRDVFKRQERLRKKVQQQESKTKMEQKVVDFYVTTGAWHGRSDAHRYEKIRVLGRGGMGVVYEATDLVLGRKVALKVLSAAFREDKLVVETFLREAKAAAMLNHVNIVTVYDAGIENNNYFIAMEVIAGSTLKEIIHERRFSISSVLRLMRQLCNGLKYAHSKKIIHRDLTNSNIMLTKDNVVKIMDFGLARIVEHLMSEQSIIGGTPSYMAPEQVQGAPIDHRADIYALGVNLFELTTGHLPFTKGDLGYHHLHTQAPDPRDHNPKIPAELAEVILKCLAKKPEDRFQSVAELAQALKIQA